VKRKILQAGLEVRDYTLKLGRIEVFQDSEVSGMMKLQSFEAPKTCKERC